MGSWVCEGEVKSVVSGEIYREVKSVTVGRWSSLSWGSSVYVCVCVCKGEGKVRMRCRERVKSM